MDKLNVIKIPKWTGSIPNSVTIGKKIGVKISNAGVISIKVPTINRIKLIINRITIGFSETVNNASLIVYGISAFAIAQDIPMEVPIKSNTIEVVTMASKIMAGNCLKEISL